MVMRKRATKPYGISVVIPAFGRALALRSAIDSVVAQPGSPVEIIVVDDASPSSLAAVIPSKNSCCVPVRVFRLARNGGPQSARNLGIRRSRYRFVAFLDSDDLFSAGKVDVLLSVLAEDDVDLLFHGLDGMERYQRIARGWLALSWLLPFRGLLALCNPIPTPALLVRNIGRLGVPGMRFSEDYAFLLHYVESTTRVRYLDAPLGSVGRPAGTPGGVSSNRREMRRGEFVARRVLLRERSFPDMACWVAGSLVGLLRLFRDLLQGLVAPPAGVRRTK